MKLRPLIAAGILSLTGCNDAGETLKTTPTDETIASTKKEIATILDDKRESTDTPKFQPIEVAEGDFEKLVDYIEKNGFISPNGNEAGADHQYTFFDSEGNRHALITIKRDEKKRPSMEGEVKHIAVWAHYKGIKDDEHFFSYFINENEIGPMENHKPWKERSDVELAYRELLNKVK